MLVKRIINKIIQQFEVKSIPTKEKVVYLTFDDGPEPSILDFVLSVISMPSARRQQNTPLMQSGLTPYCTPPCSGHPTEG